MDFTFSTAGQIQFGAGRSKGAVDAARELGSTVLLVTGSNPDRYADLVAAIAPAATVTVSHEPSFDDARAGVQTALDAGADVIVALGGGSAVDLGKAIGVLAANGGDPLDYAEVIGRGRPLQPKTLPVVAVPTTAGTGSEVTANSVLASKDDHVKVSLRQRVMIPAVAIVDPELTLGCPPAVTAASGMDALTQSLEPLTSWAATPFTDELCRAGLRAAASGLRQAYLDGSDLDARTSMSLCALMGGHGVANAKLGAVHGFAGVLGGLTGAAHGDICAALLPACTITNVAAMREREPENPALERYNLAGNDLCGVPAVEAAVEWIQETVRILEIGSLSQLGLSEDQMDAAVAGAARASSMKGNPIKLTDQELRFILEASF